MADTVVIPYAVGTFHASVCAPDDLSIGEVTEQVNVIIPKDQDKPVVWHLSRDSTFADNTPNPQPCELMPGRTHRLFSC